MMNRLIRKSTEYNRVVFSLWVRSSSSLDEGIYTLGVSLCVFNSNRFSAGHSTHSLRRAVGWLPRKRGRPDVLPVGRWDLSLGMTLAATSSRPSFTPPPFLFVAFHVVLTPSQIFWTPFAWGCVSAPPFSKKWKLQKGTQFFQGVLTRRMCFVLRVRRNRWSGHEIRGLDFGSHFKLFSFPQWKAKYGKYNQKPGRFKGWASPWASCEKIRARVRIWMVFRYILVFLSFFSF